MSLSHRERSLFHQHMLVDTVLSVRVYVFILIFVILSFCREKFNPYSS